MRLPSIQSRTRSSCQAIFVPSRISFSICSVMPLICALSPGGSRGEPVLAHLFSFINVQDLAAQLAQIFLLFAKDLQARIAVLPHQAFEVESDLPLRGN